MEIEANPLTRMSSASDLAWSEFTATADRRLMGAEVMHPCWVLFSRLPEVFQPESRPWVKVDAATADKIAEVVMTCPTGALHFERLDGGPQEPQPEETTINARPNGPLYVRGHVRITGTRRSSDSGRHAGCIMPVWSL